MELTKEECEIAWNTIKGLNYYPIKCTTNEAQDKFQIIPFNELFSNEITLIDSIINEHFDNPPLNMNNLKQLIGKPIFNNDRKEWFLLIAVRDGANKEIDVISAKKQCKETYGYRDGCFFAMEVKG